jgi:hypothetical protein
VPEGKVDGGDDAADAVVGLGGAAGAVAGSIGDGVPAAAVMCVIVGIVARSTALIPYRGIPDHPDLA